MSRAKSFLGVVTSLAAVVAVLSAAATPSAAEEPIVFGAHQQVRSGETKQTALARLERTAGRQMTAVRQFYQWNQAFPTAFETGLRSSGRTLVMSVKAKRLDGSLVPWSSIATAAPGSTRYNEIVSWARRIRDFRAPVWVTFNHEPEAPVSRQMGTSTEYVAAWRNWVRIFRAQGATNVRFMWIMTDQSFWLPASDFRAAAHWYPGDDWVEGIAGDAYNWYRCRPGINNAWTSLRDIIEPQRRFWLNHRSEQLWLTEYATTDDPNNPGRKAQWYRDARALFKTPEFRVFDGVMLFEPNYPFAGCTWAPDTTAQASTAWREWARDPFYGGPGG